MAKKKEAKKGPVPMNKDKDVAPPAQATLTPPSVDKEPVAEEPVVLPKISFEDLRTLQLYYKDAENASLRHRLMQMELENAGKVAEAARAELSKVNVAVNEKYKLDPAKDRINISDGTIVKG